MQHLQDKYSELNVYWMPSQTHTDPKKKDLAPEWMQEWYVKHNNEADVLAASAAHLHEIAEEEASIKRLSTHSEEACTRNKSVPSKNI